MDLEAVHPGDRVKNCSEFVFNTLYKSACLGMRYLCVLMNWVWLDDGQEEP